MMFSGAALAAGGGGGGRAMSDRGAAASSNVGPVREGSIRGEGERSNGLDRTTADRDRMAGLDR